VSATCSLTNWTRYLLDGYSHHYTLPAHYILYVHTCDTSTSTICKLPFFRLSKHRRVSRQRTTEKEFSHETPADGISLSHPATNQYNVSDAKKSLSLLSRLSNLTDYPGNFVLVLWVKVIIIIYWEKSLRFHSKLSVIL
jgi:hypothetical protein